MDGFLGQILGSLNPLKTRSSALRAASDSAVEKLHTVQLLFPDKPFARDDPLDHTTSLRATQNHDCSHGDVDLEYPRDVRILVAQAESGSSLGPILLFDSKQPEAPPAPDPLRPKHSRTASRTESAPGHVRTNSGTTRQLLRTPTVESIPEQAGRESPTFPDSTISNIAHRARMRRSSTPASQQPTQEQMSCTYRPIDEVVQVALDAMFENVPSNYRGVSSKLKVIPMDVKSAEPVIKNTPFGNPQMPHRRPSHLSSVFTAADFRAREAASSATAATSELSNEPSKDSAATSNTVQSAGEDPKKFKILTDEAATKAKAEEEKPKRRTIMVTRTFAVQWADDDAAGNNAAKATNPDSQAAKATKAPPAKARQVPAAQLPRPPMYSVTLLLDLPITETEVSRPSSMCGYPLRRNSGQVSLVSSLEKEKEKEKAKGFDMTDPTVFALEDSVSSIATDVDSAVAMVTAKHWDIVMRTLAHLHIIVEQKILPILRELPANGRAPRLLLHALADDGDLKALAHAAGVRVVRGFKIPRVQTGQGNWGNWRDEARWLEQWADSHDQNFLFYLLTVFLGTHTEWLNVLAPPTFRNIVVENQRLGPHGQPEDLSVPRRTIIVSASATTSRRLVYLLSQFLPANKEATRGNTTPFRPGTAQSCSSFSHSPPNPFSAPSRNESLRRSTMKRRGQAGTSLQDTTMAIKSPQASPPTELSESTGRPGMTIRFEDQEPPSRRGSDTASRPKTPKSPTTADASAATSETESTVRPENLPPLSRSNSNTDSRPSSAGKGRSPMLDVAKKSLPTHAPVAASQFAPVAYINARPRSRDSMASENLMSALQRTSSSDTQASSRWGSFKNFWNGSSRRESESIDPLDNDEGLGISSVHPDTLRSKLQQMVQEGEVDRARTAARQSTSGATSPVTSRTPEILPSRAARRHGSISKPVDIPQKMEMSVNPKDGVIDISFPFDAPPILNSPPIAGYYSASATCGKYGNSLTLMFDGRDSDRPINVAGVLNSIHPDFALQAVAPYADLEKEIKAMMRAEPLPTTAARRTFFGTDEKEDWVEVCSTIIADIRNLTLTRIRLIRKVRYLPSTIFTPAPTPASIPPGSKSKLGSHPPPPSVASKYGNPYTELQLAPVPTPITLEERFIEEKVIERDEDLTMALERVLAHSGRSSKVQSGPNSRSSSRPARRGSMNEKENKPVKSVEPAEVPHTECRARILNSLSQITHAVRRELTDEHNHGDNRIPTLRDDYTSSLREGIAKWFNDVKEENKALEKAKAEKLKAERAWYNDDAMTAREPRHKKSKSKKEKKSESEAPTSGSTTPTATPIASQFLAPPQVPAGSSRTTPSSSK